MNAYNVQIEIKRLLGRYFKDVHIEWSAAKNATDSLIRDPERYTPRTDIAVGPFNVDPGRGGEISADLISSKSLHEALSPLIANKNPRCLLAIEVVYSGSSKHLLGDLLNSSALGLYGIVVCKSEMKAKVMRNVRYIKQITELEKVPEGLFQNVLVVDIDELRALLAS